MVFFPSVEVGNPSLVMPDLELRNVAWSLTKGWSISWAAVGRAAGSRCKQSFRKLFASGERWSGISGMSLLFPILNIAATCENNTKLSRYWNQMSEGFLGPCLKEERKWLANTCALYSAHASGQKGFVLCNSEELPPRMDHILEVTYG